MRLWIKIMIALFLGMATGLILGHNAEIFRPIGSVFLNLTSMIIIPLVFSSVILGVTSIKDPQKLSRVGLKTMTLYLFMTISAIILGISFAKLFKPGFQFSLQLPLETKTAAPPYLGDLILALFPKNPLAAFIEGNVLQTVVFALFVGFAINLSGERARPLVEIFESLSSVMFSLTSIVMEFSPIGVFCIMAWISGSLGLTILFPLAKFLGVYYAACLFHLLFVFCLILFFLAKVNPKPFFKGMFNASVVAFSTCSSSAALPVAMHCVEKNLGVSQNIANFVMPLGSTLNMNGAALFQGMCAVFLAQAYNIQLDWQNLIAIVLAATFSAIGAAGVPGSGILMLSYVLGSVGLPIEGVAIFASVDRFREMLSTVLNVLGDGVCAVYVAKQEGELDERLYNQEVRLELEGDEI
jgi:dicarboxylate/amino acid:cation (Na+ or H+) symporter, DAACS family